MPSKYYAIRKGNKTGVFTTWQECEKHIKGYSGAEYKSFKTKDEAYNFVYGSLKSVNHNSKPIANISDSKVRIVHAYVDGSYNESTGEYGAGVVIISDNEKLTFSKKGDDPELRDMRNVAGELLGAIMAMEFAVENVNDLDKLIIYHDYEGIAKWARSLWKANKQGTKEYKKYFESISEKVNIEFEKVKAHSGNKYNDEADQLAKDACKTLAKPSSNTQQMQKQYDLEKTSVKNGRYAPLYNILYNKEVVALENLNNKFKEEWKSKGRTLKEIIELSILVNFENGICTWNVKTDKENLQVNINI